MKGTFRIYRDGELVAENENLLTDYGQEAIYKFLAGDQNTWANTVVVGTGETAATTADTALEFEIGRGRIDVMVPDIIGGKITAKGTIPASVYGTIVELGVYFNDENEDFASSLLSRFDPDVEPLTGTVAVTADTVNSRAGDTGAKISVAASQTETMTYTTFPKDFSTMQPEDSFELAYYVNDANASQCKVRFYNLVGTDYAEYIFTPGNSQGYYVESAVQTDFTLNGNFDWANKVVKAEFDVTAGGGGTTDFTFDGLRTTNRPVADEFGLVSHSILALADYIVKTDAETVDVEYELNITVT